MSNNEHPFSVLGYSEILAVKYLPFHPIPQFPQRIEDGCESCPPGVTEKTFDVFEQKILGFENPCDASDFKKECTSCIFKSSSLSSNAKCLARKSSGDNVNASELSNIFICDGCDIMPFHLSHRVKIGFVCLTGEFVYLAKTYTLMTRPF